MKNKTLMGLATTAMSVAVVFAAQVAWADDVGFGLSSNSSGFDNGSSKYEAGPWVLKLTSPSGLSGLGNAASESGNFKTNGVPDKKQSGLSDTEAAATYKIYAGSAYTPVINLTGKVKVNLADKSNAFGFNQNDYAAQMDIYQNLDKFTAKGTLGSKVLGSQTGLALDPLIYGSFGGMYQLTAKTSTGVDMSLSQDPASIGVKQQELSAYVNYKLDNNFKARGYVLRGYTNGNPNNAVGGQVYYGF